MRTAHPTPATPDPAHLERRIREMLASGRIHAARPLIGALRRLAPPAARLADI